MGQIVPKQAGVTQAFAKQTWLAAQGVAPQAVGWHAPATQREPTGQVVPIQSAETHWPIEQTEFAGHA